MAGTDHGSISWGIKSDLGQQLPEMNAAGLMEPSRPTPEIG